MSEKKPAGYGQPPEHSRWRKGQSGNPSGRSKGSRNLKTDLDAELAEKLHLTEAGRPIAVTKQRALLKSLLGRAISGDNRATEAVLKLVAELSDGSTDPVGEQPLSADDEALVEAFLARRSRKAVLEDGQ